MLIRLKSGWPERKAPAVGVAGSCTTATVYAYRTAGHDEWNLSRVYCRECNGGEVETPTLGTSEIVATAFLGVMQVAAAQTTRLVLTGVEVEKYSGPSDRSDP